MNSTPVDQPVPKQIRVSLGSAMVLGLSHGRMNVAPKTAYLMTYREGKCSANCAFCPQARRSAGKADMLSRISWPAFPARPVLEAIETAAKIGSIRRICIQALNYPEVFAHLQALVRMIRSQADVPISVSCQPLDGSNVRMLRSEGIERIGIPLDAATERLFEKIKGAKAEGPYDWRRQIRLLIEAVRVFGRGKVSTHLIVGLGETEEEMVGIIQKCKDMGVLPAVFAFTPIKGTSLEKRLQPSMQKYRRIQIARNLILHQKAHFADMRFDEDGKLVSFGIDRRTLEQLTRTSEPFLTSGCPDCNRPYYNEKPSGPIYNYPRELTVGELSELQGQLDLDGA